MLRGAGVRIGELIRVSPLGASVRDGSYGGMLRSRGALAQKIEAVLHWQEACVSLFSVSFFYVAEVLE